MVGVETIIMGVAPLTLQISIVTNVQVYTIYEILYKHDVLLLDLNSQMIGLRKCKCIVPLCFVL